MIRSCAYVHLQFGERDRAEELWAQGAEVMLRWSDHVSLSASNLIQGAMAELDGRLEEKLAEPDRFSSSNEDGEQLDEHALDRVIETVGILRTLLRLGRCDEALAQLEEAAQISEAGEPTRLGGRQRAPELVRQTTTSLRAVCLAHLGRDAEASDVLHEALREFGIGPEEDETPALLLADLLEAAVVAGDRGSIETLLPKLAGLAQLSLLAGRGIVNFMCPGRVLGDAAGLLGDHKAARAYYGSGLEASTRVRNRPEIALTRLGLAELLLDCYPDDREEAMGHLDFAIGELREMNMQPALKRAQSLPEMQDA